MSWGAVAATVATVGGGVAAKNQADKALDAQGRQLEKNEQFIKDQADRSRGDAIPLFDAAQVSREQGFQGALDVFGQTIPQQASVFQQGNVGAQQALLAGQQQQRNAILGLPTDLSGLQPQTLQFDTRPPTDESVLQPQNLPPTDSPVLQPQNLQFGTSFAQQQLPQTEGFQAAPTSGAILAGVSESNLGGVLSGIKSNEDLFRAASKGEIPNISASDQKFWRKHLKNVEGSPQGQGSNFVNHPQAALAKVVGIDGGFNPRNERRLAQLLKQFQTAGQV